MLACPEGYGIERDFIHNAYGGPTRREPDLCQLSAGAGLGIENQWQRGIRVMVVTPNQTALSKGLGIPEAIGDSGLLKDLFALPVDFIGRDLPQQLPQARQQLRLVSSVQENAPSTFQLASKMADRILEKREHRQLNRKLDRLRLSVEPAQSTQ